MSNKTIKRLNKLMLIVMVILMLLSVFTFGMTANAEMPEPSLDTGEYTKDMCTGGGYSAEYSKGTTESGAGYYKLSDMNSDVMKQTWEGLIERGFDEIHTAGIMGNMAYESKFDPSVIEKQGSGGFGLVQWTGGRRTNVENYAKEKGKEPGDLGLQLDFLVHEFETDYKSVFDNLKKTDNIQDATYVFLSQFERPKKELAKSACRYLVADDIYAEFTGSVSSSDKGDGEGEESVGNNGRGEYTGNLEHDPFIDEGVVQNSTGIKDGNEGTVNSQETYAVSQWIDVLVNIVLIVLIVILALYMVLLAVVILLISFTNSYISDNKAIRWLLGSEFLDKMVGEGVKGVFWKIVLRFFIGSFVLIVAITGMINGLQFVLIEFVKNLLKFVGL